MNGVILIEGIIGAGKTTLGEILERRLGVPLKRELSDGDTTALLQRFYRDPRRWAFSLQMHFLDVRQRMTRELRDQTAGILDRSLFGDRIFAEMHGAAGTITPEEIRTYSSLWYALAEHLPPPTLLVYLDCSVATALERIHERNRSGESRITAEYLQDLNERYLQWYHRYTLSPKVFVNTEAFNPSRPGDVLTIEELIASSVLS